MKLPSFLFTILLFIALLLPLPGRAADITYSTLIPQTGDSELIIAHKQAVAQGKLANGNAFANITTATTTAVKASAGVLDRVTINTAGSGASITVYDNTAGSGTKIATISANAQASLSFNVAFSTGLTIVTVGTPDVTVSYR